jgi:pimeloyl-ACP methyl ester carboxylesterase
MERSTFGYARPADGAYIGYRIDGDGPTDIVWQPDWPGNIDLEWLDPLIGPFLERLSTVARVITHDHRGVGVSSRDVGLPTLETRVSDLLAVLDATRARNPVMLGVFSSGAVNAMAAALRPELARAIVWWEPGARSAWAPDYPWGRRWEELDREVALLASWGTERYGHGVIEFEASLGNLMPEAVVSSYAIQGRNACTPDIALALARTWYDTDVRGLLPSVQTPTLLMVHEDREGSQEEARYIAGLMPNAEVRAMPGSAWTVEELPAWLDEIHRFIGGDLPSSSSDTVLATVLFTDIVDSTATQARLGDRAWRDLIEAHHLTVRRLLERFGGLEQDTAGDGFYARFDGPARAIRCAREIGAAVSELGIEIRAGVHTGECEIADVARRCLGGPRVSDGQGSGGRFRALVRGRRRARAEGRPRSMADLPGGGLTDPRAPDPARPPGSDR